MNSSLNELFQEAEVGSAESIVEKTLEEGIDQSFLFDDKSRRGTYFRFKPKYSSGIPITGRIYIPASQKTNPPKSILVIVFPQEYSIQDHFVFSISFEEASTGYYRFAIDANRFNVVGKIYIAKRFMTDIPQKLKIEIRNDVQSGVQSS